MNILINNSASSSLIALIASSRLCSTIVKRAYLERDDHRTIEWQRWAAFIEMQHSTVRMRPCYACHAAYICPLCPDCRAVLGALFNRIELATEPHWCPLVVMCTYIRAPIGALMHSLPSPHGQQQSSLSIASVLHIILCCVFPSELPHLPISER